MNNDIPYRISVPIVVTTSLVVVIVCAFASLVGVSEAFQIQHYANPIAQTDLPLLPKFYLSLIPVLSWVLIFGPIVSATLILTKWKSKLIPIVWHVCLWGLLCTFWIVLTGLTFYIMHVSVNHMLG